jgi:hypothetical protein
MRLIVFVSVIIVVLYIIFLLNGLSIWANSCVGLFGVILGSLITYQVQKETRENDKKEERIKQRTLLLFYLYDFIRSYRNLYFKSIEFSEADLKQIKAESAIIKFNLDIIAPLIVNCCSKEVESLNKLLNDIESYRSAYLGYMCNVYQKSDGNLETKTHMFDVSDYQQSLRVIIYDGYELLSWLISNCDLSSNQIFLQLSHDMQKYEELKCKLISKGVPDDIVDFYVSLKS